MSLGKDSGSGTERAVAVSTDISAPLENMESLLKEADLVRVVRRGEIVQGIIMRVDQEGILVSIGNKSEGVVPSREMRSITEEEMISLKVGEEITTRVLEAESENGSAILSVDKAREEVGWQEVERKFNDGECVEATITGHNRGGVLVEVNGLKGFIPISHVGGFQGGPEGVREEELAARIGEQVDVKILEVDRSRKRAIFSEKALLPGETGVAEGAYSPGVARGRGEKGQGVGRLRLRRFCRPWRSGRSGPHLRAFLGAGEGYGGRG